VTVILESFPAEVGLGQRVTLDHRSHGAVEQGDAAGKELAQMGVGFVAGKHGGHGDQ